MLSVLTGADIHNTAVVVTRYFGGVLLGTGGLVRAYQGAVQAALAQAQIAEQIVLTELTVCVEYALVQTMQYYMSCHPDYRTLDTVYAADVSFQIGVPAGETDRVLQELSELSKGKARISKGETRLSI
jgi:putative IMPACT (imprinted ancient) family translation regulator